MVVRHRVDVPHAKFIHVGLTTADGASTDELLDHGSSEWTLVTIEDSRSTCCGLVHGAYIIFDDE